MKMIEKKDVGNVWSLLLIVLGALFIIPGGLFLINMHIVTSLMTTGSQPIHTIHILLVGLIILIVGFVCILYPKKYRIRFIVGAFTSFYCSATFYIQYSRFIPAIKGAEESDISSPASAAGPSSQIVWLYELFLLSLVIIFVSLGVILIFLYVKPYLAQRKSILKRRTT